MEEKNSTFLQNNSAGEETTSARLNEDSKINTILQEQEKLQNLYNQIVAYLQEHPQLTPEEIAKYHTQLKQLSEYYQNNQEKLKTLGYSRVQVNKNVTIKKGDRRNIPLKTIFTIGGILLFIFVLGLTILAFYLAENSEVLGGFRSLGIEPAMAVTLLSMLSLSVMVIFLLLGLAILIMNAYRLFTIKNRSKWWYYTGMLFGVIILGVSLGAGTVLLGKVGEINISELANPNDVIIMRTPQFVNIAGGNEVRLVQDNQITSATPLIAPFTASIEVLPNHLNQYLRAMMPNNTTTTNLQLDCGNGQILRWNNGGWFDGECFYTEKATVGPDNKGGYLVSLIVNYTSNADGTEGEERFVLKTLEVKSEITVRGINAEIQKNNNEYYIDTLPAEIEFNASSVFKDFGLKEYKIQWDGDVEEFSGGFVSIVDKQNSTTFKYQYEKSGVFHVAYHIDSTSDYWYTFDIRVEQNGPKCNIDLFQLDGNKYQVKSEFLDDSAPLIKNFYYQFIDKSTNKIDRLESSMGHDFSYQFPGKGTYEVRMNFETTEGQISSCSKVLQIDEKTAFNVYYEISTSSANISNKTLNMDSILVNNVIPIVEIPSKVRLNIKKVEPTTNDTKISVYFDGNPVLASQANEYMFDIRDAVDHKINIKISDPIRGLEYEKVFSTSMSLDDIVGILKIIGDEVGFEPLQVTLDASTSKLNDINDQITYFSRNFGDGDSQNMVSNGVVKHQYHFDYTNNNGTYSPKVTIHTKKGRTITVDADKQVIVKKQLVKLEINSRTHPTQEARAGDSVEFSLDFNGLPKRITWDFGDGEHYQECEGRTCTETNTTRQKKGTYLITVNVDFEDQQSVEKTMQFRVK